jgi:predicted RNA binding protein YcfA (HicA-like mRNA interferase family)
MKSVSGKFLCKIVERYGWNLKRITGSHHIYVKEGMSVILSIPVHGIVIYLLVHSEVF